MPHPSWTYATLIWAIHAHALSCPPLPTLDYHPGMSTLPCPHDTGRCLFNGFGISPPLSNKGHTFLGNLSVNHLLLLGTHGVIVEM